MATDAVPAGSLAEWFDEMALAMREGSATDVPCGTCTACCTSSLFIRVEEGEAALEHIPADLVVPAPGQPGVLVMGYDHQGRCPMLGDAGCTIYDDRPRGCRVFDCRLFAATGIAPEAVHVELRARAHRWEFDMTSDRDAATREALDQASASADEGIGAAISAFATAVDERRRSHPTDS